MASKKKFTLARCKDGFTVSVQAGSRHYCEPRTDVGPWSSLELGFPSERDELIMEYAEDPGSPTHTVYGWVPWNIVYDLFEKHGGLIDGCVLPATSAT